MIVERSHGPTAYEDLLAASRRVDWRFLLPDPELGDLGCSADADPALEHACRLFARSVAMVDAERHDADPASFDVLVLVDPSAAALRRARSLLRPDGWLYVELHGLVTRRGARLRGPRFPSQLVAKLARLGFDEIEPHWHWPDFASCTQVLPLDSPDVLRGALAGRQRSRGRSPKLSVAVALLRLHLLPLAVTHASVVAHRPPRPGD